MRLTDLATSSIVGLQPAATLTHYPAATFPMIHPVHWLTSHFAVGGFSPLRRLSGMLTAHMTQIAPHSGFTWHPHRGLEIFTYVIDGQLYHEDTTGGRGVIRAGDVQRMFSGDYIEHQELNRFAEPARVIQIWFIAGFEHRGLSPHYEQVPLAQMPPRAVGYAEVRTIIGPGGGTDSHVAARLTAAHLPAGGSTTLELPQRDEELFLYVVDGEGSLETDDSAGVLGLYDVILAAPGATAPAIHAGPRPLKFLSFYLPPFMHQAERR
jgi:redox-sensitive bicupin YhaK (pirin superfamily)